MRKHFCVLFRKKPVVPSFGTLFLCFLWNFFQTIPRFGGSLLKEKEWGIIFKEEKRNGVWNAWKSLFFFLFFCSSAQAQDSIYYRIGSSAVISTGETAPFWLHSNSFGLYSTASCASVSSVEIRRDFGQSRKETLHWIDYGFGLSGVARADDKGDDVFLHEYYAKVRMFNFLDLIVGARKEYFGCQDSILSSGSLLFSTNARPIPKITMGIEQYSAIPFTRGYIQIKGAVVHGWMNDERYVENTLLHHKYVYVKLGGKLPVNLHYGFNHAVQWGGTIPVFGKQPTGFKDFMHIFMGKNGTDKNNIHEYNNSLGNHILSQSLQFDVKTKNSKISVYWQNINEDPPRKFVWNTMNTPDGLWGISLRNNNFPYISGLLYEYLNTTDQSGPYHDKDGIIYGGNDCYFFNGIYQSGWAYFARTIGTPFITPPVKNTNGTYSAYNNRTKVHHFGTNGSIFGYRYKFLTSLSKSYGTYSTPFPKTMKCTSMLLEVNKIFPQWWNLELTCSLAADFGKIPVVNMNTIQSGGNTFGVCLSVRKSGILFKNMN